MQLKKHVLFKEFSSVKQACLPLSHLDIDGFIFMRRFADGTFVDLSNQLAWSENFLTRYLDANIDLQHAQDHMLILPGVSLWSQNPLNTIWQEGKRDWGFYSGISIAKEGPYWTDIFCFYSRQPSVTMDKKFLKNFQFMEIFCERFVDNFHNIIQQGEREPLVTPEIYLTKNLSLTLEQQAFLDSFGMIIEPLSKREQECIYYIVKGNTAAEVGKILHISRRTVESHLQHAKDKLGVRKLSELIKLHSKKVI